MRLIWLLALPLTTACRNPCQQLCVEIADYAKDECGLVFSRDEISTCIQDHATRDVVKETRALCAEGLPTVSEEWTCEDINDYFTPSAAATDDSGGA